jgi:prepilin signal peptidase PulO-like enzyme (type II secretory pathway)
MPIWGTIVLTVFIIGLVCTFITRLKTSEYDFIPMTSGTLITSFVPGYIIGILAAILFILLLKKTRSEINWWLIMTIVVVGGGLTGVSIQIISNLPARLYLWFSKKGIVKE